MGTMNAILPPFLALGKYDNSFLQMTIIWLFNIVDIFTGAAHNKQYKYMNKILIQPIKLNDTHRIWFVFQLNLFVYDAMMIFLSLRDSRRSVAASLAPLSEFLGSYIDLLNQWLYRDNFHVVMENLWIFIVQVHL